MLPFLKVANLYSIASFESQGVDELPHSPSQLAARIHVRQVHAQVKFVLVVLRFYDVSIKS